MQVNFLAQENESLQQQVTSLQGPTDVNALHDEIRELSKRASESAARADAAQASEQAALEQLSTLRCVSTLSWQLLLGERVSRSCGCKLAGTRIRAAASTLPSHECVLRTGFSAMHASRSELEAAKQAVKEQEQENAALNTQLQGQQEHVHKLQLKLSSARAASSTGMVTTSGAQQRSAQRELELQQQFEAREDELLAEIADLAAKLDAAKTENVTLCLEVEDVAAQFQAKSSEVCSLAAGAAG